MNKLTPTLLFLTLLLLTSCEGSETKGAKQLLGEARQSIEELRYEDALIQLDSLQKTFPKALEQRQEALELTREVRMLQSVRDSAFIQPLLQEALHAVDSMYQAFTLVEAPGMPDENVIRYKGYNPSAQADASFLDIYIDYYGHLELVAGTSATYKIGTQSIRLTESVGNTYIDSDTLIYDGGMNYRYENLGLHYERLTFTSDRAAELAGFVAAAPDNAKVRVQFSLESGKKGPSFQLSTTARRAIAETYAYYTAVKSVEEMNLQLNRHEKRKEQYAQPR